MTPQDPTRSLSGMALPAHHRPGSKVSVCEHSQELCSLAYLLLELLMNGIQCILYRYALEISCCNLQT